MAMWNNQRVLEMTVWTVWTHWVHPAIFLTNEATSGNTLTQFSWPNPRVTENDVFLEDRVALPGYSRICSDQKCQKRQQQDSTSTRKHQQTSTESIMTIMLFGCFNWTWTENLPHQPRPWSLGDGRITSAAASALEHEARYPSFPAPTYLSQRGIDTD